jgi:predicted site-specific integrase-resolvase
MKLATWAKQQGVDYKTAYRWFRAGILPVPSRQLLTGTILVDAEETEESRLRRELAEVKAELHKLKTRGGHA